MQKNNAPWVVLLICCVGCGESSSTFPSASELVPPTCNASSGEWDPTPQLRLPSSITAIYIEAPSINTSSGEAWSSRKGDVCALEPDVDRCSTDGAGVPRAIVRMGEELSTLGPDELMELLAPIDTTDEAMLAVVMRAGYPAIPCSFEGQAGARAVSDGFEVVAIANATCSAPPGEREETYTKHLFHVSRDGTVEELDQATARVTSCEDQCNC